MSPCRHLTRVPLSSAGGGSEDRRQLLDAVSGALSCQLEDEAGRLRQLHRQQLQQLRAELEQLQQERQLETDQLRSQVGETPVVARGVPFFS